MLWSFISNRRGRTIIINHLTRMERSYICVAGIDPATGTHVRPTIAYNRLPVAFLARNGGIFNIGHVIRLQKAIPRPEPPHVEDHLFEPAQAVLEVVDSPGQFWDRLVSVSRNKLKDIFGSELKSVGRFKYGTESGKGMVSLGCLALQEKPNLYLEKKHSGTAQIRMDLTDGELHLDAGVTDIRFYQGNDFIPDMFRVKEVIKSMARSEKIILSVGLTRAFSSSRDFPPIHWLQVNNIHFKENPVW